jgi:NTE family protein
MASNQELIEYIKSFALFQMLSEEEINSIADYFSIEDFPKNTIVFREGDISDKIYFLVEGLAKSYIIDKSGETLILKYLLKGAHFGEVTAFLETHHTNSIITTTSCKMLTLNREDFFIIINRFVSVSICLNKLLSEQVFSTLKLISKRQKNRVIIMIISDEAMPRVLHFERYFRSINPGITVTCENITEKIDRVRGQHDWTLLKAKSMPDRNTLMNSTCVVNFVEENENPVISTYSLLDDASLWKIENTARKISKKTIGLALSSGAALGAVSVGVLSVLEREKIPIDYIVGTSSGAVIGAYYALGQSVEDMSNILIEHGGNISKQYFKALRYISFNRKGILKINYMRDAFQKILAGKQFEDTIIPFAAVSSDLRSGRINVTKSGDLLAGLTASNAAPVLFEPYRYDGKLLIDGASTDPLPIQVLIDEKIDIKIAVSVPQFDFKISTKEQLSMIDIFFISRYMMADKIMEFSSKLADVIIKPRVEGLSKEDWHHIEAIMQSGEAAANLAIKRIRYLFEELK